MKLDIPTLRALALATQVGFAIAAAVGLGVLGGLWIDDHLGTTPMFVFVGVVFGLLSAVAVMRDLLSFKRVSGEEEDRDRDSD